MNKKRNIKLKQIKYKFRKEYILYPITLVKHHQHPPTCWDGYIIKNISDDEKTKLKENVIVHAYEQLVSKEKLLAYMKKNMIFIDINEFLKHHREE